MTLQQLHYLVALDRHRHFQRAAEECGVTQPTLSALVRQLEEDLGVSLFDRTRHPVEPTPIGRRVIAEARTVLRDAHHLRELARVETTGVEGPLHMALIPTVASVVVPEFLRIFRRDYPAVNLSVRELRTQEGVVALVEGRIDVLIAATPLEDDRLLEIPIYYERFAAYFSPENRPAPGPLRAGELPGEGLWMLEEGHCLRGQVFRFCGERQAAPLPYEATSVETLVRIVDRNGGYAILPELYLNLLSDEQRQGVRPIEPPAVREVSLVVRSDYPREGVLNAVAEALKAILPAPMLDARLSRFAIRL